MAFFSSSIGQKVLMAVSGLGLILFLIAHLIGNLSIFDGPDIFNDYAEFLASMPKILWIMRIGLISFFVLHIFLAIKLSLKNKAARSVPYKKKSVIKASLSSRTMMVGGLMVLAFLLFHLAQLTWGIVLPTNYQLMDELGRHDVYTMTVLGFQNIYISGLYIIAQGFLALHLSHGFSSAGRTLGLGHQASVILEKCGKVFAVVLCLAYVSIPVCVLVGVIPL